MFEDKRREYTTKMWLSFVLSRYSRQVMRMLMPVMLFMAVFSSLFCYLFLDVFALHEQDMHNTMVVHSLLGIVLGLFLVFRMNSAYDRWWEGRIQWGLMVNNTRNLAHKFNSLLAKSDVVNRDWFSTIIVNFVYSTKEHLRDNSTVDDLVVPASDCGNEFKNRLKKVKHIPNRLSSMLYERTMQLYRDSKITGDQLYIVDKELKQFSDILGACERIKNTPIPYSYTMYIKKFIFLYLLTLPFGFVTVMGYMTIFAMLLISYILLGIELIAEEIEDPFGHDINDLPTDRISANIKENLQEIFSVSIGKPAKSVEKVLQ